MSLLLRAAGTAAIVTGVQRWWGVAREDTWHAGSGYLLLGSRVVHVWCVRRALRARRRGPGPGQPWARSAKRL